LIRRVIVRPQIGDKLGKPTIDDRGVRPGLAGRRRGHHELLDAVDETGERLVVAARVLAGIASFEETYLTSDSLMTPVPGWMVAE
jgi:hypothetical protein